MDPLTRAEADVGECLGLAVAADGGEADVIRLSTLQLLQITLVILGLARRSVAVCCDGGHQVGAGAHGRAPGHLGRVVVTVQGGCHIFS